MSVATGTALAIGTGVAAAGGLASAAIGANAAGNAADVQANAADTAAELQHQDAQDALNFNESVWNTQQGNEAPFLVAGTKAIGELSDLTGTPGQGLLAPWTQEYTPPTLAQAEEYPGYQFQLEQGENAINENAAATGNLASGSTLNAEDTFAQGLAQEDYSNIDAQQFRNYQQAYNQFLTNNTNEFNKLSALSGGGQVAANTVGTEGTAAAANTSNTLLTSGQQIGQNINNAAAATASGYVGTANAYGGGLNNLSSTVGNDVLLSSLLKAQSPNGGPSSAYANPGNDQYSEYAPVSS